MGRKLSPDAKKAAAEILTHIKAPTTEWQIGKTKVFLRNTVFEPLEDALRGLLNERVVMIQKHFRGHVHRKRYKAKRAGIVRIQVYGGFFCPTHSSPTSN